MKIQPIVIGTAGHIDHGKSTLVEALTGVDPDRWKEEKERGVTIDLGFAPLELPDGRIVGLVDVPGHERFVRNMVAGASGIDLVVLVVAADDGVMPQTREHLAIMQILGVRRGFVALTKIDAVDPEMVELATLDVRETIAGTFLNEAPILPVSAITGEGMDELRKLLVEMAQEIEPRSQEGVFRMPIQRVFSARGFGTIVTGIPISGSLAVGDVAEVLPLGKRGKVRGLQAYKEKCEEARAGHSTAINISDVDHHEVQRGDVIAAPGYFRPVTMVGAQLTALSGTERRIADRTRVRLHTGTVEALGEVVLLDHDDLGPGETGLAQVRLREPIVCAPGDLFVLRLESPSVTIGGGTILEESKHRLKRYKAFVLEELAQQSSSLSSKADLIEVVLQRAREPMSLEEITVTVKEPRDTALALIADLEREGRAVSPGKSGKWLAPSRLNGLVDTFVQSVETYFAANPHRVQVDVREMRSASELADKLFNMVLEEAESRGKVERSSGGQLSLAGRSVELDEETQKLRDGLVGALERGGFQPPSFAEVASALRTAEAPLTKVLELCVDRGDIVRVSKDLHLAASNVDAARQHVIDNCEKNGKLEIPELRDALKTTRKFLIPLLEYFDVQGVTLRQGGHRVLKRR